ncbi:hypothetical protein G6M26_28145 [Agrobacterium tumefaciens]|nr:hypothetical protein [Agrobacterium tumefaciens]NTE22423.1 hypothetical protein [Agrobacterium tumefaciens]
MKTMMFALIILVPHFVNAQNTTKEKVKIKKVIQNFRQSIIKKDAVLFNQLFHENPVVWIGVVKDRTQKKVLELNPADTTTFFRVTYESFFKYILKSGKTEEKFENIKIINDDVIASVTFNYSFWNEKAMTNWGNEYWQLIKVKGQWKIVSIIYSYELTKFYPKPL